MDASFYNLGLELKEKGIQFESFNMDYDEGTFDVRDWFEDED